MGNLRLIISIIHKRLIMPRKREESKCSLSSDVNTVLECAQGRLRNEVG